MFQKILLTLFLSLLPLLLIAPFTHASSFEGNKILIKFKKNIGTNLPSFSETYNLISQESPFQEEKGYFSFLVKDGETVDQKINEIRKNRLVRSVQPNFIFNSTKKKVQSKSLTNDRFIGRQWWLYNNGTTGTTGSDIGISDVWPKESKDWKDVSIGIIDSGVNLKHEDLKNNVSRGYDFVHSKNKQMQDKEGHGSFLAGLIASKVNNKKGIAGLSRLNHLKIVPLKFNFTTEEAVSAINYAKKKGIRILNASWGSNEFDQALYDTIKDYDGLIISASGNETKEHEGTNVFYPCDFDLPNVICVGASNAIDSMASYSDWGGGTDLFAPGGEDNSPLISLDVKTNKYVEAAGTSFSAALVSGAAGIALSKNPSFSPLEIKNLILETVNKKEELTNKSTSGGILNVGSLVNR